MIRKGMFIGDRYEIVDKVGSGGMSDVYKALDHKLNRYVAIKVLKPEFSEDKTFVSKFKVEAQSAAGLVHPNIVNVYDVGEDDTLHYIVMELIDGITLKKYIEKKGPLPVKEAVSIAIQVSQGIEAAHNNNIIHRDIKPQNIMISREGKVKVTDFGIARAASSNTINSNAMGSVHYISPEQARGGYIDEKSDIYSLGITLYELITGKVPFEGDSTVSVALQHINDEIPSPKEIVPDLPVSVEKIILKCTQKSVDRRYQNMEDVIADLKHSLIDPQGDFVTLTSVDNEAKTVVISDKELGEIKHMPKQIAKQLEEVQVFGIFRLYRVKENVLDGDNTLPQSGTNRDFCYSSGYEYWGKMESDGNVLSSGKKETVLRSNKKKIEKDATYDIVVHYEVIQAKEDSAATFRVRNAQDEIIAEQEMPKDATKITIKDVSVITGMEWVRYRINAEKGSKIRIRSIETIAQ